MKNRWGWQESWQQSRQVLHRWPQILSIAYALPQLLATYYRTEAQPLMGLTPWRANNHIPAGLVRLDLQIFSAMSGFETGGAKNRENSSHQSRVNWLQNRAKLSNQILGRIKEQQWRAQVPIRHCNELAHDTLTLSFK
jgi:hypothetical protein